MTRNVANEFLVLRLPSTQISDLSAVIEGFSQCQDTDAFKVAYDALSNWKVHSCEEIVATMIAMNPEISEDIVQSLLARNQDLVATALALNPAIQESVQRELFESGQVQILEALALNSRLAPSLQRELAGSKNLFVLLALASNPHVSNETLAELFLARDRLETRQHSWQLTQQIYCNMTTPFQIFKTILPEATKDPSLAGLSFCDLPNMPPPYNVWHFKDKFVSADLIAWASSNGIPCRRFRGSRGYHESSQDCVFPFTGSY
jgi:hypothetical protein